MTGMLASVNSMAEALMVLAEGVDIVDFKNPAAGSLGALDIALVKNIVAELRGKCLTSATIGDLPMDAELVFLAVQAMAETRVDYVKIGFFPDGDVRQVIDKLSEIAINSNLIAVLFADAYPEIELINTLIGAGFRGIMLDTMKKARGSLSDLMPLTSIKHFVAEVKSSGGLCGLAGSLNFEDIPLLLPFQPDYLGFRGALCEHHSRTGQIHRPFVRNIKQSLCAFSK